MGTSCQREGERRELSGDTPGFSVDLRENRGGKMSQNNEDTLTARGPDLTSITLHPTRKPKPPKPENAITITIGISAQVLFNMEKEQQGLEDYIKYQVEHETQPFSPGPAFSFVKLFIERFCMTGGNSPIGYLKAYHTNLVPRSYMTALQRPKRVSLLYVCMCIYTHLFLITHSGIAAATVFTPEKITEVSDTQLRVAFDGDGVLFSDESERIFKAHGLEKFLEYEKKHENKPLEHGPLKGFLEALEKLQKKFYDKGQRMDCPIRTYLVTSRGAHSSGNRALKTLQSWGLEIDEAFFLSGAPKGPILEKIRPHIFFDDKMSYVEEAVKIGTVACH
ncbi:hypothetical protein F7725_019939, partial [Dissostichus mawsoni]